MEENSIFYKTRSVILAIVLSYFLIVIKFQYLSESILDAVGEVEIWMVIEFGGSFLCIVLPILLLWCKIKFKLRYLLYTLPTIFILVLLYSPSGLYFIIPKGRFFTTSPVIEDWRYGIPISIMFYILQLFTLSIAKGIYAFRQDGKREKE